MCNQCTRNAVALLTLGFTAPNISFIPEYGDREGMSEKEYKQALADYTKTWAHVRESIGTLLTGAIPEDGSTNEAGLHKIAEHLSNLSPHALLAISNYAATMAEALTYTAENAHRALEAAAEAGDDEAQAVLSDSRRHSMHVIVLETPRDRGPRGGGSDRSPLAH